MKLTCVTAVFNAIKAENRERLIRCVESVAKLKTEHEHLIYDGASTDGTVELLRELEKKTPGLKVVSEPDTGIYNALNKGVRDAAGEWFYVLGCDDYICRPEVMDGLVANAGVEDIVSTDVFKGDPADRIIRYISFEQILWFTPYCHQGVLMRTAEIRQNGGFDESYRIAADYKLFLKSHMAGAGVKYYFGPDMMFASFGMTGVSEMNREAMYHDFDCVLADVLRLDVDMVKASRQRSYYPFFVFARYLFSQDVALRTCARRMLLPWYRGCARKWVLPLVVLSRPFRAMWRRISG